MADENKPEAGAKPEEIADQDLTEVVGGVRAVQGSAKSDSVSISRTNSSTDESDPGPVDVSWLTEATTKPI